MIQLYSSLTKEIQIICWLVKTVVVLKLSKSEKNSQTTKYI